MRVMKKEGWWRKQWVWRKGMLLHAHAHVHFSFQRGRATQLEIVACAPRGTCELRDPRRARNGCDHNAARPVDETRGDAEVLEQQDLRTDRKRYVASLATFLASAGIAEADAEATAPP